MRIAAINVLPNGSPANIMRGILDIAKNELNADCVSFYGNWKNTTTNYKGSIRFGFRLENYISAFLANKLGLMNIGSIFGTISLIFKLKKFQPDIIHLHNLHLPCINIPILFYYIKKSNIKVVWTLHDCWAFTGRCPYFQVTKCDKWKIGCGDCPYPRHSYPASEIDTSSLMWKLKKRCFTGINDIILVTPSKWLAQLVGQSFLSNYNVVVINNGIDLNVFKPSNSDFKDRIHGNGKFIILGVAMNWNYFKGIDVFINLSKLLDNSYKIVLVGVDKKLKRTLPDNIFCIERTQDAFELAKIYTASDILITPTREENFPTVCMESIACGTPVITFDTGGCAEIVNENCGFVTSEKNTQAVLKCLEQIQVIKQSKFNTCLKRSKDFDQVIKFKEYLKYYTSTL